MKQRDDSIFLYHIFEACENIISMLAPIAFEELLRNQEKQAAVL